MEIKVMQDILASNDAIAEANAKLLSEKQIFSLNLMASPGAGKTSFILRSIEALKNKYNIAVIEGDIASSVDAEKIQKFGIPSVQINTGGACHLEAHMIKKALEQLELDEIDLLIIENVGNLVCPVDFKLGEDLRVMILSVPEGDDKPLKYPSIFRECSVLIVNKIDLLNFTNFNLENLKKVVKKLNPQINIFPLSCTTGKGLEQWLTWLEKLLQGATVK
jgi:hydrogenase nickel incorporation protein HypB